MERLDRLYARVDAFIEELPGAPARRRAYTHSYGVAGCAAILAARRGLDAELAATAGLLHDLYAYQAGTYEDHCHRGAAWAAEFLGALGGYGAGEIATVRSAIYYHDDRGDLHGPQDEVLKDADILQPYLQRLQMPEPGPTRDRLLGALGELGVPLGGEPGE